MPLSFKVFYHSHGPEALWSLTYLRSHQTIFLGRTSSTLCIIVSAELCNTEYLSPSLLSETQFPLPLQENHTQTQANLLVEKVKSVTQCGPSVISFDGSSTDRLTMIRYMAVKCLTLFLGSSQMQIRGSCGL